MQANVSSLAARIANAKRRFLRDTSANTMVLGALALTITVGGAGLATDTAQWYMWKRELQYAVDQAAMAGAYSMSKDDLPPGQEKVRWKQSASAEFNRNIDKVTFRDNPQMSVADFGNGKDNSVIVRATASRALPFSSMFMATPVTVRVRSQAVFSAEATYKSCIVATNETETGAITIGGNATVAIGCGMAALSTADDAIQVNGSPTVDAGFLIAAGTVDDWFADNTSDQIFENVSGLKDPFKELTPPNNSTPRTYKCATAGKGGKKVIANLLPGTYSSIDTACDTVFAPGVYVIDGGQLKINAQHIVSGTGVMFVLKNGATMKINGGANINLTAPTITELDAMGIDDERLAGMLVFEDPDSEGGESTLNGNATTILNGKIYLGQSTLNITGSANVTSQCLMLVADKLKISGTGDLGSFCPTGQEIDTVIGTQKAKVNLVA